MQVSSACPLRVASLVWQPRPAAFALTIVCKATFTLRPGISPLASAQEKPWKADLPWGNDPRASLWAANDLAPFKRRLDVILIGHAYAPRGELVTSLIARLAVGAVDKQIEVHGDRSWTPHGQITAATPFAKAPLRWERAAGGPGTRNPVGIPASAPLDAHGLRPAPSLLPPSTALRSPADLLPPVGFGPVAPSWPDRTAKLRRHAATFRHDAWVERPLPEDIDTGYFNVAPPDQQLERLADEGILLVHLHPEYPQLATVLERVIPHVALHRSGSAPQELRLRCDTLWIDADRGICTLTWRGAVPLWHAAEEGAVIVTMERPQAEHDVVETLAPPRATADAASVSAFAATEAPVLETRSGGADTADMTSTLVPKPPSTLPGDNLPFAARPVLPFAPVLVAALGQAPASPATGVLGVGTGTLAPGLGPVPVEPLPFQTAPAAAEPVPTRAAVPPPPAPAALIPSPLTPEAAPEESSPMSEPATRALEERPRRITPPPPPLMGPLASKAPPEISEEPATARRSSAPAPPAAEPPQPLPAPAPGTSSPDAPASAAPHTAPPPTSPEPVVRPEDFPVERFASVSAELAEQRAPRAEVLRAHGLSERAWSAVERHFRAALDKDARSSGRLCAVHDTAYVAAVEGFRGPITLPEFAQIAVGLERGEANEALAALKIHRAALMPIVRVWTKKTASDWKLSEQLRTLLEKRRAE